jgi:hypothetical protein
MVGIILLRMAIIKPINSPRVGRANTIGWQLGIEGNILIGPFIISIYIILIIFYQKIIFFWFCRVEVGVCPEGVKSVNGLAGAFEQKLTVSPSQIHSKL